MKGELVVFLIISVLCILAVIGFIRLFIYQVNRIRENKRHVRMAMAKWLLEKADECELKEEEEEEEDTKTWPGPRAVA